MTKYRVENIIGYIKQLIATVILTLVIAINFATVSAQSVDSLIKVAALAPDTLKPSLYNDICWKLRNSSPLDGIRYGHTALSLSAELGMHEQEGIAYNYIGTCEKNIGDFNKALEYINRALEINLQYGNDAQIVYSYINLGNLHINLNDLEKASDYFESVEPLIQRVSDPNILAYYHLNIGRYLLCKGNYECAQREFDTSLVLKRGRDSETTAAIIKNIGDLKSLQGDTTQALSYYFRIICDSISRNNKPLLSNVFNTVAVIYLHRNNYDSAIYYASQALDFAMSVGAKHRIGLSYGTLGKAYYMKKNYKKASEIFKKELDFSNQVFNEKLNQNLVSIRFAAESEKKQMEIDKLARGQNIQLTFNIILVAILLLILLMLVLITSTTRKTKKLNQELDIQKNALATTNANLTESIVYAQRIQQSTVNTEEQVAEIFPDSMIYYQPKDIVSGDWYRVEMRRGLKIVVEADCTGHGVPGSLLSMMGISALKDILNDMDINNEPIDPGEVLNRMRVTVKNMLREQSNDGMSVNDGMDMSVGVYDPNTKILKFAAAYQMAILIRNGESIKLKGDRMPIGNHPREKKFTSQEIQLCSGDSLFFMSDGIKDQTNPQMQKFKGPRLDDFLLSNITLPMPEIGQRLRTTMETWQGTARQVDDMTMVGFRID